MPREFKPMTLRALCEYWHCDIEKLMDAQISVGVHDGHRHFDSYAQDMNFPMINLQYHGPEGKTPFLRFDALLSDYRLVSTKKEKNAA